MRKELLLSQRRHRKLLRLLKLQKLRLLLRLRHQQKTLRLNSLDNLVRIAKAVKSDGTDGGLVISFLSMNAEDLEISEPVFVYFDGLPVPFFIEDISPRGNTKAVVHLTDVRSFDDAEELVGRDIFVNDLQDGDENDYPDDLLGWTIFTSEGKSLGQVSDYLDIPGNPCIEVSEDGKSPVILPLHEDFVLEVDPETRTVIMELPEGLVP